MSNIGIGDVVVRVKGTLIIPLGTVLRVDGLCIHEEWDEDPNTVGLLFDGFRYETTDHCECFAIDCFRKIEKADKEFTETIYACRPIKRREPA